MTANLQTVESRITDIEAMSPIDAYDEADKLTSQLSALTVVASGAEFLTWNKEIQTNYLWAVHEMAKRIEDVLPRIIEK